MHRALPGLAENPALPPDLVDRLITAADADLAEALADRPDLTHEQIRALSHFEAAAIRLAHNGKLTAADVDPDTRPRVALALLVERTGRPEWAGRLAANPNVGIREALAACPDLSNDVIQALAADPEDGTCIHSTPLRHGSHCSPWLEEILRSGRICSPISVICRSHRGHVPYHWSQ